MTNPLTSLKSKLASVFLGEPNVGKYPSLTRHQAWKAALGAPASDRYSASDTTIYPFNRISPEQAQTPLKNTWEVTDHDTALKMLSYLSNGATTEPHPAWFIVRAANVARICFAAGYINEQETWSVLEAISPLARAAYPSWDAYGKDYLAGREAYYTEIGTDVASSQAELAYVVNELMGNGQEQPGLWKALAWDELDKPDAPFVQNDADLLSVKY